MKGDDMTSSLHELVQHRLASAHAVRTALQGALRDVRGDQEAEQWIERLVVEARAHEHDLARLAELLHSGRYGHVDDVIERLETDGAVLARQWIAPATCKLCGGEQIVDMYELPHGDTRCVTGCTQCGLAYDHDP
ncbi:MAG: hypothetical protein NZ481_09215 [Candidatus Kapabacteria bacterium]|nr:hypothetical protein [Candidatus Kapabacteria bacterium]